MRNVEQKYGSHFDCTNFSIWNIILPLDAESGFRSFLFKSVGEANLI